MRTVYGLKMIAIDDVIGKTGGRPTICNYLKEDPSILNRFDDDEKLVIGTGLNSGFTIYNMTKPYMLVFISIDLLEEKLILDSLVPNMEEVSKMLLTVKRAQKVERIVSKYTDSYEKFSNKYSGDSLGTQPCFMFVFDDSDKLVDVYTAIPQDVLGFLAKPIEYKCSACNVVKYAINTSFDEFIPDMYYKVIDNEVDYRCEEHKGGDFKHVGE